MENYEQDPFGVEDDFHSQFAAELEVLAELEGASGLPLSRTPQPPVGQPQLSFEEAITREDAATCSSLVGSLQKGKDGARKRKLDSDVHRDRVLPPSMSAGLAAGAGVGCEAGEVSLAPPCVPTAPRIKWPRLEVVKRLNFESEEEMEESLPNSLQWGITPPPSPKVPAELWGDGPLDTGADTDPMSASPAARNPVLRRPPVLEDYINVTSTGGDRAFLVLWADPTGMGVQSPLLDIRWRRHSQLDLLGVPFASLKEQVDGKRQQRQFEEAQQLSDVLHSLRPEEEEFPQPVRAPEEEPEVADGQDASHHYLWVDEFAPRHYMELLSDDFTNRCLLKWLKLWDLVVFGRERPTWKPRPSTELPRVGKEAAASGKWKSYEQVLEEMLEAELDASQRPQQKVALLCGPPGLGKTTLAHVIARHAGYCVVEMNASDDRSPEAFRTCIEAATQMESVLGAGGRPNCLVIDEIDGAPTAAVHVLLSILDRRGPQEGEPRGQAVPKGRGRQHQVEGGLLMRPIICICNDQFAPSLRQLKQQALLLHFPPTLSSRLVQRLQEISQRWGMQADPGVLVALCEKTDNDIRACINTLQFLHGQGRRELSAQAVQSMHIGLKDQRKGLFAVWQEVFQLPRAKRCHVDQDLAPSAHMLLTRDIGPCPAEMASICVSQRFHRVLHVAASAGEHEKVVQGLYDNFLRLRLRDPRLGTVCAALDWLAFDDLLARATLRGQSFQLLRYPLILPVAFHLLFAAAHVPRLAFPSSQQEAQNRTSRTQDLIQTLVSGITPSARSRTMPQALVLDALCPLLDILTPKLRPVSTQLYSACEKQQLADLVGTMLAYSLTYRQERALNGQYTYRLEPNVKEICCFPELPTRKPLTYQAKQLIAHEIEVEKMRRAEALAQVAQGPQADGGPPGTEHSLRDEQKGVRHSAPCNHEQRLEFIMRKATFEEQPERDFFGRVIVRSVAAPSKHVAPAEDTAPGKDVVEWFIGTAVGKSHVWFRFSEGVSNAVRRHVHIRDLL
ncbi:chromosome transmission fidelity protein 18 homolog isoform X1 [Loxodonta africana]|uniref:chromosome transmission fidelity protein 18 homolog isoform X1 n=1 Tax=Loxodonta africana TaxID=9785 RepID=UPI0030D28FF6